MSQENKPSPPQFDSERGTLFEHGSRYEYDRLQDPNIRYEYVNYTERLIQNIRESETESVVFLDKSARPVAWLVKELWPILAVDSNGEVDKLPDIKFANIDREQWSGIVGRSEDKQGGINVDLIPERTIDNLRATFTKKTLEHDESAQDEQTMFTDKKVMIVDEVMASGDTLEIARGIFKRAFPDAADIEGRYWMTPERKRTKGGVTINARLPIWYNSDEVRGRLVANREDHLSSQASNPRQRRGAQFLSTRFPEIDESGVQLKHDMQQLAEEVKDGFMPVTPSSQRGVDEADYLIEKINNVSVEEFIRLKRQAEAEKTSFPELFASYKRALLQNNHR